MTNSGIDVRDGPPARGRASACVPAPLAQARPAIIPKRAGGRLPSFAAVANRSGNLPDATALFTGPLRLPFHGRRRRWPQEPARKRPSGGNEVRNVLESSALQKSRGGPAAGRVSLPAACCAVPAGPNRLKHPGRFPPLLSAAQYAAVARSAGLTPREAEVLTVLTCGLSDAGVATELGVSLETARKHRQAVLRKCGCTSRLQLVLGLVHQFLLRVASDGGHEQSGPTP